MVYFKFPAALLLFLAFFPNELVANHLTTAAVEDSYIVTLKPDVETAVFSAHTAWVNKVHAASVSAVTARNNGKKLTGVDRVFDVAGYKGYSGRFDSATLEEIKKSNLVSTFLLIVKI